MRKYSCLITLLAAVNNIIATPISRSSETEEELIAINSNYIYAGIALFILLTVIILILVINKGNNSPRVNSVSNESERKTDPVAIISFAAGLGGFVILPILFVPVGYIAAIVSYFRLKENKELKGRVLRIIGALLTTVNILWLMYQFKIGVFNF